jgi:DNA topoisomerase-1
MSKLIIVESPGKIKKIKSLLDSSYNVMASIGHIRDLAKESISVDINDNFKPNYEILTDKKKVVSNLKKAVKDASEIYIAADGDREGEAIAFHLVDVLKIKDYKRIVFNEITQSAINDAISNPRQIDINMFYSQQTRRILDRIVGYKLSPILKSIPNIQSTSLGAGRVQSVVTRLIVDKEQEISLFINQDSSSIYAISAEFIINNSKLSTKYISNDVTNREEIKQIVLNIKKDPKFIIESVDIKERFKNPPQPFITSSLQQEASYKLKFQLKKTMLVAQKLYEKGLITYMRTDSPNLSNDALSYIKKYIIDDKSLGESYYQFRQFKTKNSNAQEAHEAIRPTNFNIYNLDSHNLSSTDEESLYQLIFDRTVASQMKSAKYNDQHIILNNQSDNRFEGTYSILVFDGYLKIYLETNIDSENNLANNIINIIPNNKIEWIKIIFKETYKNAPTRYSEPSLVKKLETLGIGRPSTYASIISKIQEHKYIKVGNVDGIEKKIVTFTLYYDGMRFEKKSSMQRIAYEKSKLIPTPDGIIITEYLINNFEQIIDYKFTSNMEKSLDEIAEGNKIWYEILNEFYQIFSEQFIKLNIDINSQYIKSSKTNNIDIGIHPKYGNINYVETKYGPTFKIKKGNKDLFVKTTEIKETDQSTLELAIKLIDNKIKYLTKK